MSDKPKAFTNNNVYILGAGFAKDAGYPLVADFLDRARDSVAWLREAGRKVEADAVSAVLAFRLDAASAAYRVHVDVEDIEQLFSLASAREGASESLSDQVKLCIAATLDYARAHETGAVVKMTMSGSGKPPSATWKLIEKPNQADEARMFQVPLYEYYAGVMASVFDDAPEGGNTIITLNYDTLTESALQSLGCRVSYGFAEVQGGKVNYDPSWTRSQGRGAPVQVLKLHGSVNWARPGRQGGKLRVYGSYDDVRGAGLTPVLVPPTWRKEFGDALGGIWNAATRAIEQATRIYVIGFSIPETDPHFKYLLAAGLQNNISLRKLYYVNPGLAEGKPERSPLYARLLAILREELMQKGVVVPLDWKCGHLFCDSSNGFLLKRGPSGKFDFKTWPHVPAG